MGAHNVLGGGGTNGKGPNFKVTSAEALNNA